MRLTAIARWLVLAGCLDVVLTIAGGPSAVAQESKSVTEDGAKIPKWLAGADAGQTDFRLIRDRRAREQYDVYGRGLAVVVVDSGVNASHRSLDGRVLPGIDLTGNGDADDTQDRVGSGSHRAGIIAARGGPSVADGVAPATMVIPVRVYDHSGTVSVERLVEALNWIADAKERYRGEHGVLVSAVCLGIGVGGNYRDIDHVPGRLTPIRTAIRRLYELNIVVCAPAGNEFFKHGGAEGMTFPAIAPETISVGAVYDADVSPQADDSGPLIVYGDGAKVFATKRDTVAAFSQRLCAELAMDGQATDVFAPGVSIASCGTREDDVFVQSGTAVSTAYAAGAVVLLQEKCRMLTSHLGDEDWLPSVELIRRCLHRGGVEIVDIDDTVKPLDNVKHTHHEYRRLDVLQSLSVLEDLYQSDVMRIRQQLIKQSKQGDGNTFQPEGDKPFSILGRDLNVKQ